MVTTVDGLNPIDVVVGHIDSHTKTSYENSTSEEYSYKSFHFQFPYLHDNTEIKYGFPQKEICPYCKKTIAIQYGLDIIYLIEANKYNENILIKTVLRKVLSLYIWILFAFFLILQLIVVLILLHEDPDFILNLTTIVLQIGISGLLFFFSFLITYFWNIPDVRKEIAGEPILIMRGKLPKGIQIKDRHAILSSLTILNDKHHKIVGSKGVKMVIDEFGQESRSHNETLVDTLNITIRAFLSSDPRYKEYSLSSPQQFYGSVIRS